MYNLKCDSTLGMSFSMMKIWGVLERSNQMWPGLKGASCDGAKTKNHSPVAGIHGAERHPENKN